MTLDYVKLTFRKFQITYLNLVAKSKTRYGYFVIGSTLSHQQLLPLESHITVITNIEHVQQNSYSQHDYIQLPLSFLSDEIPPTN